MPRAALTVGLEEIDNVFQLLGYSEDDISAAIAWSLARSPAFLAEFLTCALKRSPKHTNVHVQVHRYEGEGGITDIELSEAGNFHLIVEAKRGWSFPSLDQLQRYARRESFVLDRKAQKRLVTLSECSQEYAAAHLPAKRVNGFPVVHISWADVVRCAKGALSGAGQAERRLLHELLSYFSHVMTTQRKDSNWVFVVALGSDIPARWRISWIDVVRKYSRYFHPVGPRWPKEPPAYMGFRYGGKLQSIHFVERYEVIDDLSRACAGIPRTPVDPHFLYFLGPPIVPPHEVRSGNIYRNGRVWCAIDTLLTCKTISDAHHVTQARLGEV